MYAKLSDKVRCYYDATGIRPLLDLLSQRKYKFTVQPNDHLSYVMQYLNDHVRHAWRLHRFEASGGIEHNDVHLQGLMGQTCPSLKRSGPKQDQQLGSQESAYFEVRYSL